jgi:hypothetical protein
MQRNYFFRKGEEFIPIFNDIHCSGNLTTIFTEGLHKVHKAVRVSLVFFEKILCGPSGKKYLWDERPKQKKGCR